MRFVYDDGGRKDAGYKGSAGDCLARSLAIAAQIPYTDAYALINDHASKERRSKGRSSARNGVYAPTAKKVLAALGWEWVPTMGIGVGCRVHLTPDELPAGRLVVRLSKHFTAVVDGVIRDTFDPNDREVWYTPDGTPINAGPRCVYGYWRKGGE